MIDKKFLSDPEQWPKMAEGIPYCCLKRLIKPHIYEHGFILENPLTVYLGPIFDGGTGEFEQYENIDELLQAGWLVD